MEQLQFNFMDDQPGDQQKLIRHKHRSPLRYPGGKGSLSAYVKSIIKANRITDGVYIEPYAGGAAVALELLASEHIGSIHINDIDPGIHAFWNAVLFDTTNLIKLIRDTPITIDARLEAKVVRATNKNPYSTELGFSTFFLNRVNRSGVISGGVIGGNNQTGNYLIDARYNKPDLIHRIESVARFRNRIKLTNLDALVLLEETVPTISPKHLLYLDPPYFMKGSKLYTNYYRAADHAAIASKLRELERINWMVSYDSCPEINELFEGFTKVSYDLTYSAYNTGNGREVMFFSPFLENIPSVHENRRVSPIELI